MKRLLASLGAVLLALAFSLPAAASTGDTGHGYFWVFDGSNGAGQYAGFGLPASSQTILFTGSNYRFTGNCPDITGCKVMNNNITSLKLSCGSSASTFGPYDEVWLFNSDNATGSYLDITTAVASCVNGVRTYNLPSAWNNVVGSMVLINSNG